MHKTSSTPKKKVISTAIVGAGVSGLYLGKKLAEQPNKGEISIYEKEERIGGRLYSEEVPNTGGLTAENGGMRFIESQTNLKQLVDELGIKTIPADHLSKQIFHFARGQQIAIGDYKEPGKIPYELREVEQGKMPHELMLYAFDQIVPGYSLAQTEDDCIALLDAIRINEKPLFEYDLAVLVKKVLSEEAYKLIHDTDGFRDLFEGHNAYTKLLHNFKDLQPGKKFYRLEGGMKSLVNGLADRAHSNGVTIYIGHHLIAVTLFDPLAKDPVFVLAFVGKDNVHARHIILTLSPMALLKIEGCLLNSKTSDLVENSKRTVTGVKVFLVYDKPWWHEKGLINGRIHTSTESQQIYDFGTTDKGAMLCIYKDVDPKWTINESTHLYNNRETVSKDLGVPDEVIKQIIDELRTIFNDSTIQAPHTAFWKVWKNENGAFFQWRPGFKYEEVKEALHNPAHNVHITGDSFGKGTGWVAEALDEADKTLAMIIKPAL